MKEKLKTRASSKKCNEEQALLELKVIGLGYKSCFDYISQHGAMSFRNNILAN